MEGVTLPSSLCFYHQKVERTAHLCTSTYLVLVHLFIYWSIFSVYSCTVIFCRDLVYRAYSGLGEMLERDIFRLKILRKWVTPVARIMITPPCFRFFWWNPSALFCWWSLCLCPKLTSLINIFVNHALFPLYRVISAFRERAWRLLFCEMAHFRRINVRRCYWF